MTQAFLNLVSSNTLARDIMTTKLITLTPDTDVFDAIEVLSKNKISGAPVVDEEGNLLGTFSEKSVMHVLVDAVYEQLQAATIDRIMHREPLTIDESNQLVSIAQIFLTERVSPASGAKGREVGWSNQSPGCGDKSVADGRATFI